MGARTWTSCRRRNKRNLNSVHSSSFSTNDSEFISFSTNPVSFHSRKMISSWFGPLMDVAGPCVACVVGMEECDLVAVAEGVSDQRRWCEAEVFVQGGVSCAY